MKYRVFFLAALFAQLCTAQVVTFYTPRTVRVQKAAEGQEPAPRFDYVVTAKPEGVKVKTQTTGTVTTYSSSALRVSVDRATGVVTFADAKGQPLVGERAHALTPIAEGPDAGRYRVRQSWALAPDEPLYGVGLLQNGKMSQRGENRLMTQSNLEDFANVFQSPKGYGIYWDNYSPTQLDTRDGLTLESQVGESARSSGTGPNREVR